MKIIQFTDSFLPVMDGVGNVVSQYARHMGQKGQECYVVAPQTDTGFRGGWPFELVDYVGLPLHRLKSYTVGMPGVDAHCRSRLAMLHPEIVHVHSPFVAGHAGLSFARARNLPVVGTFHSKYYDDFLQVTGVELLAEVGVRHVVDFYNECTEVWAVSESSAGTLRDYGYEGKIRVMPNGTDIHTVTPEKVAAVTAEYGLDKQPTLLYVGQINWKKNLRCTLEACGRLKTDFKLVLAGQGPHEKVIRALAEELGIADRVLFTGHLTDQDTLNALYAAASLFVFPSLYDTSGLVVREAAAQNTPSVVVRGSSAAECIRDGENGLLCENDPADLARVIEGAISAPQMKTLSALGAAAKRTIPIPWGEIVDGVLDRYREILS